MEFYTQWRLRGDNYNGGFGNGLTLADSESTQKMKKIEESENETIFCGQYGHTIKCIHEKQGDVTVCRTIFENTTDKMATIELLSSFAIRGIQADYIHRAQSFWSAEGKLLSQKLTDLNMEESWSKWGIRIEKFGQLGSMPVRKWFPFLVLEDRENQNFVGVQIYCASSWQIEIMNRNGEIYIQGGLPDRDYGSWWKNVAPNESFETPKAVVAVGKSLNEVCDKLVKAQKPRIAKIDRDMPVVFNEFGTTWSNPTLDILGRIAKRLEGSGIRYLVIDCGWFRPNGNAWGAAVGEWVPSKELFPNGIKEAADLIKSHGLIPGLWFEMECVGDGAKNVYNMTEHLLKRDGYPITVGERRFWDMRDPWVKDYLDERMIGLLRDAGFGYLKVDYNESVGAGLDGAESYGEGLYEAILASQDYFRHIAEELPELVIENCASGGHRLEPSMMEVCSQASFSDAHECKSIPLIAANLHRLIRPEQSQIWTVLQADADMHRIYYLLTSAFLGRMCISGGIFDLTDEQWQATLDAIAFYDRIKHIIRDGYTSIIETTAQNYNTPKGYQVVLRELNNEALLIVHTFENGANPPMEKFLKGYIIKEKFGSELDGDFRGKVYWLQKEQN